MSYVRCIYYVTQTIQSTSLACAAGATLERLHEGRKGLEASSIPFTHSPLTLYKN